MIVQCPYCDREAPVFCNGTVRCQDCLRQYYVHRQGRRTTTWAVAGEKQLRYIGFELLDLEAGVFRATRQSTGYDLAAIESGLVWPGFCRAFDTGVRLYMAPDQHVDLRQRSGWFRKGLVVNAGLIDPDFTDSVKILCRCVRPWPIRVRIGDRLAQIVLPDDTLLIQHGAPYPVEAPIEGRERIGGLGSTGR